MFIDLMSEAIDIGNIQCDFLCSSVIRFKSFKGTLKAIVDPQRPTAVPTFSRPKQAILDYNLTGEDQERHCYTLTT